MNFLELQRITDLEPVGVVLQGGDAAEALPAGLRDLRDRRMPPGCPQWEQQHKVQRIARPVRLIDVLQRFRRRPQLGGAAPGRGLRARHR